MGIAFLTTPQPLEKYLTLRKKRTPFPELLVFLVFADDIEENDLYDISAIDR